MQTSQIEAWNMAGKHSQFKPTSWISAMTGSEIILQLLQDSSTQPTCVWFQAVYDWENKQGNCYVSLKVKF